MAEGRPGRVLISRADIAARVAELGRAIGREYAGRNPLLVGVLKGAAIFLSDLVRTIPVPIAIDFMGVSSYDGGVRSSGIVRLTSDLSVSIEGRDVLIVEGICASGLTLSYLMRNFQTRNPASIKVCAFVSKKREGPAFLLPDYIGHEIPDVWVVGYGLDWEEQYRNLPHVARLT